MRLNSVFFLAVATSFALLTGCAADGTPPATGDENLTKDGQPDGISALVTFGDAWKHEVGACTMNLETIRATVADAAVSTRIEEVLRADAQKTQDSVADCSTPTTIEGSYSVSYNRWNLLSIVYSGTSFAEGSASPRDDLRAFNFDLRTGELIPLHGVLNTEGVAALVDECKAQISGFESECESSVSAGAVWSIDRGGLVIHPVAIPHVAFDLAKKGALATWMLLDGFVVHTAFGEVMGGIP